jgi:hypothetical protein
MQFGCPGRALSLARFGLGHGGVISPNRTQATYRCVFCGELTSGPARRAPPCPKCGRTTTRVLEP